MSEHDHLVKYAKRLSEAQGQVRAAADVVWYLNL